MTGFDPYYKWLGIAPKDQPPHYYRLLAIDVFESDADVIAGAADRQMAYVRQCAGGEHADASQQLLSELAQARLCLLNGEKKQRYDAKLRAQLASGRTNESGAMASPAATPSPIRSRWPSRLPGGTRRSWIAGSVAVVVVALLLAWASSRPASISQRSVAGKAETSSPQNDVVDNSSFSEIAAESDVEPEPDLDDPPAKPKAAIERIDNNGLFENRIGMQLKRIAAGEFQMGTPPALSAETDERPRHTVRISRDFYLGVREVTKREYVAVMEGRNIEGLASSEYPVDQVTWYNAASFCEKLSTLAGGTYRLPTEAEWEYACRAGSETTWFFGERHEQLAEYAWTSRNSSKAPHPVARLKPNPLGLFDLCGNLAEWCQDWYGGDYYSSVETEFIDPQGPPVPGRGNVKVVRGGSWDEDPLRCRSGFRGTCSVSQVSPRIGFRVVREVESESGGIAAAMRSAPSPSAPTEDASTPSEPTQSPNTPEPGPDPSATTSAPSTKQPSAAPDADFVSLFDGYSLSGWSGRGYQVINGAIVHTHTERGAFLSTNKQFADFIFKCEVRVPPDGNNGIGFRAAPNADETHMMEIQIFDDTSLKHKNLKPIHRFGALLGVAAPRPGLMKPAGEWNDLEISCDGTIVTVMLNGTQALKVNLTTVVRAGKQARKNVLKFQQPRGHLVLMGFSGRVAFRNLKIKELPGK